MIHELVIPLSLLFMPWVLVRYVFSTQKTRGLKYQTQAVYMWLASGFWFLSQLLPLVRIGDTDTFIMHTLGGVVATLLYIYALKVYQIKFEEWWQPWVGLFLFACGLGVLNELLEFFLFATGVWTVVDRDEWWDLTANTLGSFAAYAVAKLFRL